jgi:uncharacterized protein (TIGR02594 family)
MEPKWLARARAFIGLREVPGVATAPVIARWLVQLKAWWKDDETPWCGTFVAAVLEAEGFPKPPHWYRARAWLNFGTALTHPAVGALVIFERKGGGHVGFLVGQDERGRLMVLGGNQGNSVNVAPFERSRVLGYRWPQTNIVPGGYLPLVASNGAKASINEA